MPDHEKAAGASAAQLRIVTAPNDLEALKLVENELQTAAADIRSRGAPLRIILVSRSTDETSNLLHAKELHDIRGAVRTLNLGVTAIQNGYRFDDAMAGAKIQALANAVTTLERQLTVLTQILA